MESQCRLCAEFSSTITSIFSFHKNRLIHDLITLQCPIKVDPADEHPKNICQKCLKILIDSQELREKSVKSDIIFKSKKSVPQIVEAVTIKEEDPINPVNVFEDDDMEVEPSEEESDFAPYIPVKPSNKYEIVNNRYKCPNCLKTFTHSSNVNRHIRTDHAGEKINYLKGNEEGVDKNMTENIEEKRIFTCDICGQTFTHTNSNLRRHIRKMHSEYYQKPSFTQLDEIINNYPAPDQSTPSEISQKFFNTKQKQKYLKFIEVTNVNSNLFEYQCKICVKKGRAKLFAQNINNPGTSNIRRHLVFKHKDIFMKYEKNYFD